MKRLSAFAAGLLLIGLAAFPLTQSASGQAGDGWITLVDGTKMGDWDRVGKANWRMEDGALVADKMTGKGTAHLVSKNSYKDFQIRAEFWSSDDANSGIFIRCDRSDQDQRHKRLRGEHLRHAPGPELRHRRDRRFRRGRSDAQGRRQVEHLRDHRQGPASR